MIDQAFPDIAGLDSQIEVRSLLYNVTDWAAKSACGKNLDLQFLGLLLNTLNVKKRWKFELESFTIRQQGSFDIETSEAAEFEKLLLGSYEVEEGMFESRSTFEYTSRSPRRAIGYSLMLPQEVERI